MLALDFFLFTLQGLQSVGDDTHIQDECSSLEGLPEA